MIYIHSLFDIVALAFTNGAASIYAVNVFVFVVVFDGLVVVLVCGFLLIAVQIVRRGIKVFFVRATMLRT
jgi:hypothetical protein